MRTRRLGRSGILVSEIGAGLWGAGAWSGSTDAECRQSLQLACDLGCTFFDSAWSYGAGRADSMVGGLVADNPGRRLVVAGKVPPKNMKWPASGMDRIEDVYPVDHVIDHAERTRDAMGVDRVDLIQFHGWDDAWAGSPTFEQAVDALKSRGLARAVGLSLNRLQPANGLRAVETGLVDCVQVVYNVLDQAAEDELIPACIEKDIGVIARVPLDEGSLGGCLTTATRFPPDDWRSRYFGPENLAETVRRVEAVRGALPQGVSLPQAALRFVLSNPGVSTVIVGMRRGSHVRENLAASVQGPLDQESLARLRLHRWDRG